MFKLFDVFNQNTLPTASETREYEELCTRKRSLTEKEIRKMIIRACEREENEIIIDRSEGTLSEEMIKKLEELGYNTSFEKQFWYKYWKVSW